MAGSGSKINYYLRTSKCIERKMICETFHRLFEFKPLNKYRYIGFGSFYFTDFMLFHKEFGISNMISIESKVSEKARYVFNKPLKSLKIEFGKSTEVLPTLLWPEKNENIVWLDYDSCFEPYMLEDASIITSNINSGSIYLMSCNRRISKDETETLENGNEDEQNELEKFKLKFGTKVPLGINEDDLYTNKSYNVIKKMIDDEISKTLMERNSGVDENMKFIYEQLFFFTYRDGAPMVTIGGIFIQKKDMAKFWKCNFESIDFISKDNLPYEINAPCLTYKEISLINKKLPCKNTSKISVPGVKQKDIDKYVKLYRYFPYYMEVQSFN